MEITLQYFDDCPNWRITEAHLHTLITDHALDATVTYQSIETPQRPLPNTASGAHGTVRFPV